jgi:hypothetical protein
VVDFIETTEDPLTNVEWERDDLEFKKFTSEGKIRAVFTS